MTTADSSLNSYMVENFEAYLFDLTFLPYVVYVNI